MYADFGSNHLRFLHSKERVAKKLNYAVSQINKFFGFSKKIVYSIDCLKLMSEAGNLSAKDGRIMKEVLKITLCLFYLFSISKSYQYSVL